MKVLDINGTLIRADKIVGFSELHSINPKESAFNWCWGFEVYATTEITIALEYNTNPEKARANAYRTSIINIWKQYLQKEFNANNRTTLRHKSRRTASYDL